MISISDFERLGFGNKGKIMYFLRHGSLEPADEEREEAHHNQSNPATSSDISKGTSISHTVVCRTLDLNLQSVWVSESAHKAYGGSRPASLYYLNDAQNMALKGLEKLVVLD